MGGNDRGESYLDSGGMLLMDSAGSHSLPACFLSVCRFIFKLHVVAVWVCFLLLFFLPQDVLSTDEVVLTQTVVVLTQNTVEVFVDLRKSCTVS